MVHCSGRFLLRALSQGMLCPAGQVLPQPAVNSRANCLASTKPQQLSCVKVWCNFGVMSLVEILRWQTGMMLGLVFDVYAHAGVLCCWQGEFCLYCK